jgi:HAD superfamily hydrolase (TIGR01509 family)
MLFDLDGTLVNIPSIWNFFDEILVQTLAEFKITSPSEATRLELWHSGGEFQSVLHSWGVEDYESFITHFDEIDHKKRQELIAKGIIHLFDDVDVLEPLHERIPLGLLTNTPPEIAMLEIKSFSLERYFKGLVMLGTEEQEIAKPEPDGFFRLLNKFGVPPEKAVMVGDSSSDIIGGNRVGMITVLIKRPNQPAPSNLDPPPDLTTTNLRDLLKFQLPGPG